jgi:very-short-patch-repair endonuclease
MHKPEVDRSLAALARRQHGLVTHDQARALGASRSLLENRRSTGLLLAEGHHVLRLAGAPVTDHQRLLAAVLDAGPAAAATLRSAAALWELPGYRFAAPDVVVPIGSNHRPSLGKITETRTLPEHHVTTVAAIPVVTPARLIVELAGREHPRRVERAAENAIAAGSLTAAALALVVGELAGRGRRGSTLLKRLVDDLSSGEAPPASELEARFRDLVEGAGLPQGLRQLDAGGEHWVGRVDVAYPAHRLLIELDGRRWHDSRSAMESDRRRDNDLVAAGWRVVRITWRQLVDDPVGVVALLRRLLTTAAAA